MNIPSYYQSYQSLISGGANAKYLEASRYLKNTGKADMQSLHARLSKDANKANAELASKLQGVKGDALSLKQSVRDVASAKGEDAIAALKDMAGAYNNLIDAAGQGGGSRTSQELASIGKTYARTFARMGISISSKGKMEIDEKKLSAAAEDGSLNKIFSGATNGNYGIAGRLSRAADKISSAPASFMGNMMREHMMNTLFTGVGLLYNLEV